MIWIVAIVCFWLIFELLGEMALSVAAIADAVERLEAEGSSDLPFDGPDGDVDRVALRLIQGGGEGT
jgi:hypothetical protein